MNMASIVFMSCHAILPEVWDLSVPLSLCRVFDLDPAGKVSLSLVRVLDPEQARAMGTDKQKKEEVPINLLSG